MTLEELIEQVLEGEEPEKVVKTLLDQGTITEKGVAIVQFKKPSDMMRATADLEDIGKKEGVDFQVAAKNELMFVGKAFSEACRKVVAKYGATIKESQNEINVKNIGGYKSDSSPNPLGGINNQIYLANSGDAGKARTILMKKDIHFTDQGNGVFGFDINSTRDGAAQALNADGIQIRRVA